MRTKNESTSIPLLKPDGHDFIKADNPRREEKCGCSHVPCLHHLMHVPKSIAIWRRSFPGESKLEGNIVKLFPIHDVEESERLRVGASDEWS